MLEQDPENGQDSQELIPVEQLWLSNFVEQLSMCFCHLPYGFDIGGIDLDCFELLNDVV